MNNTKLKEQIAGLPEGEAMAWRDSGCNEYPEIDCGHRAAGFDTDDLKALVAAVPEWVSVSERLPDKNGEYWVAYSFGAWVGNGRRLYYGTAELLDGQWFCRGRVEAWYAPVAPYQEDKDDIEEKIRKVTERGDAITGDEFERERR